MPIRGVVAPATQAPHEHGVVGEGLRSVDQPAEHLVVPRGREAELGTDRLLFRTRMAPPFTLEGEEGEFTVRKSHAITLTADRAGSGMPRHPRAEGIHLGEDVAVESE